MALLESSKSDINSPIIDFTLMGIDDRNHSPDEFDDKDVLIIIFICNHCPYVKAVMDRFVAFREKYKAKGVQLIGINPNDTVTYPQDSFDNMKLFAEEYSMNFPYLIDDTQETAKNYDAVCTPDIYVYDKDRKLKYRGRFDDNWQDEKSVTTNDLEKAVELILQGKDVDFKQIPSMGCSIKWKS
ncbi:MAG: thioredoxin family protein [Ignavibacteria bacterium]|nr:thioredoxin family protein [Ignavibacteria bacterium]